MYRLLTKESRLNAQATQFDSLIKQGYTQEVYKGLNIFCKEEAGRKPLMKIFKDTAANHISFYSYQSIERMNQAKENAKNSYDRSAAYKAEQKTNKTSSTAANCSAAVKAELKEKFPAVKFSVTCSNFSGGNSVDIRWSDGPCTSEVEAITGKYQYGRFNGMEDIYEYSNEVKGLPQAKYVHAQRDMSDETRALLMPLATEIFNNHDFGCHSADNLLHRIFCNTSIPAGATITGIEKTDCTCGNVDDFYKVSFTSPETKEAATSPNIEKVEVKAGQIQVIEYGEKAIAVIGDTRPIKDKLKALGGRFNFRLTCGAGWIFPKTKLAELQTALTA